MSDSAHSLERLLMVIREFDKKQIDSALQQIWALRQQSLADKITSNTKSRRQIGHTTTFETFRSESDRDKVDIIGALPIFLLTDEKFKKQKGIIEFAINGLGIPRKMISDKNRSKQELIGIIVSYIAETNDSSKLSQIREALSLILGKRERGQAKDFFTEWDDAIKKIRTRS